MRLLIFFLIVLSFFSCHDIDRSTKEVVYLAKSPLENPRWTPPSPSKGFDITLYSQPDHGYQDEMEGFNVEGESNSIIGFPEPDAIEQKKHWKKKWGRSEYLGERGYIEAPADGWIEVSAQWASGFDARIGEGEIGLYINDNLKKSFNVKNAELITDRLTINGKHYQAGYRLYANMPVKASDKIVFKEVKWPVIRVVNTIVYFKPDAKDDKISGEDTNTPVSAPSGGLGSQGEGNSSTGSRD